MPYQDACTIVLIGMAGCCHHTHGSNHIIDLKQRSGCATGLKLSTQHVLQLQEVLAAYIIINKHAGLPFLCNMMKNKSFAFLYF